MEFVVPYQSKRYNPPLVRTPSPRLLERLCDYKADVRLSRRLHAATTAVWCLVRFVNYANSHHISTYLVAVSISPISARSTISIYFKTMNAYSNF